jgi:hypothetical protein
VVTFHRNTGAFTMAGQTLRTHAPLASTSLTSTPSAPHRVIASSRTRCNHGVFLLGHELAIVYSSRRSADGQSVTLSLGNGPGDAAVGMTPTQARAMARALTSAAAAIELRRA